MLHPGEILLGQHDLSYRQFFTHLRMIRDLLREIVGEAWVELIDFSSAEKVEASFVSRRRKKRESDIIWKFRRFDGKAPIYLYVLLEHQSRPDRFMAVRLMTYVGLFYESLIKQQKLLPSGLLPQVIPLVLYNGMAEWNSALELSELIERFHPSAERYVPFLPFHLIREGAYPAEKLAEQESPVADLFRLERSRDWEDVSFGISQVKQHVRPEELDLRQTFESWIEEVILPRLGLSREEIPRGITLEESESMLAERIDMWNRRLREESLHEGRQQGLQQGQQQGLQKGLQKGLAEMLLRQLKAQFGSVSPATRRRILAAEPDLLLQWGERFARATSLAEVFGE
jgi:predicted transposase/invertase (TIGR01784 family)